jgi:hypothetical protein
MSSSPTHSTPVPSINLRPHLRWAQQPTIPQYDRIENLEKQLSETTARLDAITSQLEQQKEQQNQQQQPRLHNQDSPQDILQSLSSHRNLEELIANAVQQALVVILPSMLHQMMPLMMTSLVSNMVPSTQESTGYHNQHTSSSASSSSNLPLATEQSKMPSIYNIREDPTESILAQQQATMTKSSISSDRIASDEDNQMAVEGRQNEAN